MIELLYLILPYILTALAVVVVFLAGKYLHITINKEVIERLLYAIINQITNVELQYKGETGLEKQRRVIAEIEQGFPDKHKSILKKVYGGLDVAVERAFQLSHLAHRSKPILAFAKKVIDKV